jgi:hypothetical protein
LWSNPYLNRQTNTQKIHKNILGKKVQKFKLVYFKKTNKKPAFRAGMMEMSKKLKS